MTAHTGSRIRSATLAAVVAALAVAATPPAPAHADDQGFLDYLESHGFQYTPSVDTPAKAVQFGRNICASLHLGGSAGPQTTWKTAGSATGILLDAAQQQLCPDTLGPGQP